MPRIDNAARDDNRVTGLVATDSDGTAFAVQGDASTGAIFGTASTASAAISNAARDGNRVTGLVATDAATGLAFAVQGDADTGAIFIDGGGGGGGTTWGQITGDLEDQTDLQNALDAKADVGDLDDYVTLGTTQTISGAKTFSSVITGTGSAMFSGNYNAIPLTPGVYLGIPTALNPRFTISNGTANQTVAIDNNLGSLRFVHSGSGSVMGSFSISTFETNRSILNNPGSSSSSGVFSAMSLVPIINQSGTAGYNALLVNVTETSTGSGDKVLIRAQIGGSDRLRVLNSGLVTVTNRITGVSNATGSTDAVNLSQLDARLSPAQRSAINALTSGASTMDIVNALQAT